MMLSLVLAIAASGAQTQPSSAPPPFRAAPPAPPVPAPPIMLRELPGTAASEPAIVRFRAGEARCGDAVQRPTLAEEPFPTGTTHYAGRPAPSGDGNIRLTFRIGADGRPLGIKAQSAPHLGIDTRDVAAAFAAWRFAAGPERTGCEISFAIDSVPVSRADRETVQRFLILQPLGGAPIQHVGRAAFRRSLPPGSDCVDPRPNVRLQAFPAFEEIPQPAGTASYSFVDYDIAADGSTRAARLSGSSGNRELDRQSLAAIARTRYQPGIRKGCSYPFYRRQTDPLRAPVPPEEAAFRPEDATCPAERPAWAHMPALVFPEEFRRRGIEGWAVVRYDVSPWGATGNVSAVASEPAASFGEQAVRIVTGSRRAASAQGYTGCVVRVVFVLPERGADPDMP